MNKIAIFTILILTILLGCSTQVQPQVPTGQGQQPSQGQVAPQPEQTAPSAGDVAPSGQGNVGIKTDVEISNFQFSPQTITIPKGTTIIWTNKDSAPHNIVSTDIKSETFRTGETYAYTFPSTGTYEYRCGIHPSMIGTVIVQ